MSSPHPATRDATTCEKPYEQRVYCPHGLSMLQPLYLAWRLQSLQQCRHRRAALLSKSEPLLGSKCLPAQFGAFEEARAVTCRYLSKSIVQQDNRGTRLRTLKSCWPSRTPRLACYQGQCPDLPSCPGIAARKRSLQPQAPPMSSAEARLQSRREGYALGIPFPLR